MPAIASAFAKSYFYDPSNRPIVVVRTTVHLPWIRLHMSRKTALEISVWVLVTTAPPGATGLETWSQALVATNP